MSKIARYRPRETIHRVSRIRPSRDGSAQLAERREEGQGRQATTDQVLCAGSPNTEWTYEPFHSGELSTPCDGSSSNSGARTVM